MIRCIIVDDEPLALRQMRSYVARVDELELVGSFGSATEARKFIDMGGDVELIFCDINMPRQSGVEFVRALQEESSVGDATMVIFTTAHAEYAVEGFRLDAVDYLLKPLSFGDFSRSVARASSLYTLRQGGVSHNEAEVDANANSQDESQYITIKSEYRQVPICIRDIVFLESEGEYIRFHLSSGRAVTTFYRLKNMEAELPSTQFVRIHRSYIVNMDSIVSYERGRVYISDIDYLPIGQNYRDTFQSAMQSRR